MKFSVAHVNIYNEELYHTVVTCDDILDAPVRAGLADSDDRSFLDDVESMVDYFADNGQRLSVLVLENI